MAEVAADFGQQSATVENAQAILDEIIGLIGQVSDTQAQRIRSLLPKLAAEQLEQIKLLFSHMTMQRLREMMTTGEMDAQFQQVWSRQSGNDFDLVAGFLMVPRGPGLGIVVDEAAVEAAARVGHRWRAPVWRHADGSVAEW